MTRDECAAVAVRFVVDTLRREGAQFFKPLARRTRHRVMRLCPGSADYSRRAVVTAAIREAAEAGVLEIEPAYVAYGVPAAGLVRLRCGVLKRVGLSGTDEIKSKEKGE